MSVVIELSAEIEAALRESNGNVNQAAKEALVVEMYRQGRLTHSQFSNSLGLSRDEANGLLKRHGVQEDLISAEELHAQLHSIGLG